MTTLALAAVILVQDPSAEERARQILERIDEVFARFREETLRGVRRLVEEDLAPYRRATGGEDPGLTALASLASRIVDDGADNTLIRNALSNPAGRREILQALTAASIPPDQALERMFDRREDGRYQVKAEYSAMLLSIARAYPNPPTPTPPTPSGQPYVGLRTDAAFANEQRTQLGLQPGQGVRILSVTPGSPAAQGGLLAGDVILSAAGQDVTEANFREILSRFTVGQEIPFVVLRGEERPTVTIRVGQR